MNDAAGTPKEVALPGALAPAGIDTGANPPTAAAATGPAAAAEAATTAGASCPSGDAQ